MRFLPAIRQVSGCVSEGGYFQMRKVNNIMLKWRVWMSVKNDISGQDLIEYALMAGFVAVAAGAIMPGVASSISTIFSKVASCCPAEADPRLNFF
jgi:Flp pilus assembly pilin Flp